MSSIQSMPMSMTEHLAINSALNSNGAALKAGELADIELPMAPLTDWLSSLFWLNGLAWFGGVMVLMALILWLLSQNRQFQGSLMGSLISWYWRVYRIKKHLRKQPNNPQHEDIAVQLYPLIANLKWRLQQQVGIKASPEILAAQKQTESVYLLLQKQLFSNQVSRETLTQANQQLLQNLIALCRMHPYWVMVKEQFTLRIDNLLQRRLLKPSAEDSAANRAGLAKAEANKLDKTLTLPKSNTSSSLPNAANTQRVTPRENT